MPPVPLGSSIIPKKPFYSTIFKTIYTKVINLKFHTKLGIAKFMSDYQVKYKAKVLIGYAFDVVVTGLILWYIFHGTYKFISYGLASVVGLYYLKKVVEIIKYKEDKK